MIGNKQYLEDLSKGNCAPPANIINLGRGSGAGRIGPTGPTGPTGPAGAFLVQSLTTAQRVALTPTTAFIVEDTDLDMYFKWSTVTSTWSTF